MFSLIIKWASLSVKLSQTSSKASWKSFFFGGKEDCGTTWLMSSSVEWWSRMRDRTWFMRPEAWRSRLFNILGQVLLVEFAVLDLRHVAWDGQRSFRKLVVRLTARDPELRTPVLSIYNFQTTFPPPPHPFPVYHVNRANNRVETWWEWPPLDGSDPNFIPLLFFFIPFVKLAIAYCSSWNIKPTGLVAS